MPHLRFSRLATRDLLRLEAFLREKSPSAAAKAVSEIRARLQLLEQFADAGRPVPSLLGYREMMIDFGNGGYVVRYKRQGDAVVIVGLRHMREAGF